MIHPNNYLYSISKYPVCILTNTQSDTSHFLCSVSMRNMASVCHVRLPIWNSSSNFGREHSSTKWKKTNVELLVGGLEHEFYFPFHIWVILPMDSYFSRWLKHVKNHQPGWLYSSNLSDISRRILSIPFSHPLAYLCSYHCAQQLKNSYFGWPHIATIMWLILDTQQVNV